MNVEAWRNTLQNIAQLLTLLEENPHISVVEDVEGDDDEADAEKVCFTLFPFRHNK